MTRRTGSRRAALPRPCLPARPGEQRRVDEITDAIADALQGVSARDALADLVAAGRIELDDLRELAPRLRPDCVLTWHERVRGARCGAAWIQRAPLAELAALEQWGPHTPDDVDRWSGYLPEDVPMLAVQRFLPTLEVRDWWRAAGAAGIPSSAFAAGFALVAVGAVDATEA